MIVKVAPLHKCVCVVRYGSFNCFCFFFNIFLVCGVECVAEIKIVGCVLTAVVHVRDLRKSQSKCAPQIQGWALAVEKVKMSA